MFACAAVHVTSKIVDIKDSPNSNIIYDSIESIMSIEISKYCFYRLKFNLINFYTLNELPGFMKSYSKSLSNKAGDTKFFCHKNWFQLSFSSSAC